MELAVRQEKTTTGSKKFQTGNILTIAIGHFLHDIYGSFLAPILPLLIKKFSLSYTLAGLLTVFQNSAALLNPFIGIVADRISARYLIVLSPVVTATLMSLLPLSPSYTFLAVILLFVGISNSCWHVPTPVIIRNLAGDRLGTGMSFFMLGGELARSIGPIVILGAVSLWGMEGTFRMIPLGVAASILLYFRLKKITIRALGDRAVHRQAQGLLRQFVGVFFEMKRFFLIIAGISFSRAIITRALNSFLPTFLTSQGSSLWLSGVSLSLLELAGAAGTFAAGAVSDRIGRRKTLFIIKTVSPLMMMLFLLAKGFWIMPILIILGLFSFASAPITLALVQENAGDHPAAANGVIMTMAFFFGAISVFLVGLLSDQIGLAGSYWICAILSLVGIPCSLLLPKEHGVKAQS